VMFVIVDLRIPYRGLFGIPSTAMREALSDMNAQDVPDTAPLRP